jgi:hypothetical protein
MAATIIPNVDTYAQYLYLVDIDDEEAGGTITVTDDDENPVDPYSYLDKLIPEAVDSHRAALDEAIADLTGLGYTVSPGERPER